MIAELGINDPIILVAAVLFIICCIIYIVRH